LFKFIMGCAWFLTFGINHTENNMATEDYHEREKAVVDIMADWIISDLDIEARKRKEAQKMAGLVFENPLTY
jgi:hypothetical protein